MTEPWEPPVAVLQAQLGGLKHSVESIEGKVDVLLARDAERRGRATFFHGAGAAAWLLVGSLVAAGVQFVFHVQLPSLHG